jgi:hypothetical protein
MRHSHYVRVRLGGVIIWRVQCTTCKAVFTVLPHFILRHRQMRPDVARDALLAPHWSLSLELGAVLCHISPMALCRLVCALDHQSLVVVLIRCGLPLPPMFCRVKSTAAVSSTKCICRRWSVDVSSGIWVTQKMPVPQP